MATSQLTHAEFDTIRDASDRLVLGARHKDLGMTRFGDYTVERMVEFTKSNLEIITGVRETDRTAMRGKGGGYLIER